jgi:CheY-like chemotaxis protein
MAVNLSPRQFRQKNLLEMVERTLRNTGLLPKYLELEIIESLLMEDIENATHLIGMMKNMGLSLTMDDFGTGYSSLSYLNLFSFDKIKIDRSFVQNITSDPTSATIAKTMIALGHNLKLHVIAEGIETEAQLSFLRTHGCDEIQGYYFSKPVPANRFEIMIREDQRLMIPEKSKDSPDRTLLLVDDEYEVLNALKRAFREDGYHILTAKNAEEGFEQFAKNPIGVVISDEQMPGMRGIEFLQKIKNIYPDTVRIVLTAFGDQSTVTEAVNKGAVYKFHSKPWEPEILRKSIREAFEYYKNSISQCV